MSGWPMRRIVIAGGGTAGWMAAAAIGKTLGKLADVTLVESDAIGTIGVGESTIPPMRTYNNLLGIDEAEFMRATQATFKLGIEFDDWAHIGDRYFHSFGTTGKDHWSAGFQHFWLNGQERGHSEPYDAYCLELQAAYAGKFVHLPGDGLNYAYQLDSTRYAVFLRALAEREGVVRREGMIEAVEKSADGRVDALVLESGERIEGDFFLDCTGFRALLIGDTLGSAFEDWTHWLPCDRAIALQTESVEPARPYTRAMAHDAGWQWRIPLQNRTGNGIVYCSKYLDDDAARERLLGKIEGLTTSEPRLLRFRAGVRPRQWVANCLAVGLSGGFMEPLESTSIHLIQRAVLRLLRMLPMSGVSDRDIAEFNDQHLQDMLQIRDFIVLHYKATQRDDSAFWRYCRDMSVPDTLTHKIELFRETGRVFRRNEELFQENSWVQVMMGQGIFPRSHHPIASKLTDDELSHFLGGIRDGIARSVESMPGHEAYIAGYCREARPAAAAAQPA
jgi:tryptophan halogenase